MLLLLNYDTGGLNQGKEQCISTEMNKIQDLGGRVNTP